LYRKRQEEIMHVYVVIAHPNRGSFNHALLAAFADGLREAEHTFDVRDLYADSFAPLLEGDAFLREVAEGEGERLYGPPPDDVLREQERVSGADALAFIYPVWWTDCPAILKGWFDRLLTYGYAYEFVEGELRSMLHHKKAVVMHLPGRRWRC
jgi:NAD(P)H dehydrogenase (quinone)